MLGIVTMVIFTVKGAATYFQTVMLSRIGYRIIAENQRRMFAKLMHESLGYFANRHSSEFLSRLTVGANSATQVLNLLITAIGRDLLSLIALVIVMIVQDPVLSLIALVVAPPALLILRKLIRRIRTIARNQFTGGTLIMETMQEALQGIRIVKAFTLEDQMQARIDTHIAEVERESNKMARVGNRASPLMETLGGIAIAIALVYGGYRVIETGATPGQFFSFITAFLLAYEPAKRLARLNLDLNSGLVGVRILFEVLDSPATEPSEAGKPALKLQNGRIEFDKVSFEYRPGEPMLRDLSFVAEPGQVTALVGPSGGGKSTILNLILRFFEASSGVHRDRRAEHRRGVAPVAAPADRLCRAGRVPVPRHHPRQHRLRPARRHQEEIVPPRRRRTRMISSWLLRAAMTRQWASTDCRSPAGSASASRWRGR